ncbi:MAG: hypothetical protein ABSA74_01985 [Candidatus Staskawiczbacteria bacterium]|jgi:hypothetical protein
MNTFLKNNWFKMIIAVAVLIIALAIGCYFAIYLPRQNYANQLFTKKADCQKYTTSIKDEIDKENANPFGGISYLEMVFYSPKEDSCLYATDKLTTYDNNDSKREYFIYNALTGSKITSFQFPSQWNDYKKFLLEYSNGEIRL